MSLRDMLKFRSRNIICVCRSAETDCEFLCDRWKTQLPSKCFKLPAWPLKKSDFKHGQMENNDS